MRYRSAPALLLLACLAACAAETTGTATDSGSGRPGVDAAPDAPDADDGGASDTGEDADAAPDDSGDVDAADAAAGEVDASSTDASDTGGTDATDTSSDATDAGDTGTSDSGADSATSDAADSADGDADDDAGVCLEFTLDAAESLRPVDVIWAIDASPSMDDEIARIESELNAFAAGIGATGLDYRVVVIGSDREQYIPAEAHEFYAICVPPPLSGAPGCPDTDGDRYLHVREPIHSREALSETVATYAGWRDFVRPDANVHFVIVTDDNERGSGAVASFETFANTTAGLAGRWTLHSIVELIERNESCWIDDTCSCGENRGDVYLTLSERSGGLQLSICESDWSSLFDALRERVAVEERVPCTFDLPSPGEGFEVDTDAVEVRAVTGSSTVTLTAHETTDGCGPAGGWTWADSRRDRILLCPTSCGTAIDSVEVELGCVRVKL